MENRKKFRKEIIKLSKQGIQADMPHLKKDMCAQFADPFEFVREYVVNAYDAQATCCTINGLENADHTTIIIQDNGHGMSKDGVIDFFTLYRSRKWGDPQRTVGRFGIGKLSVAAIPGQNAFKMLTSNGKDCWEAQAGSLLHNDPIKLFQIRPVREAGTTFEISFKKKEGLREVMLKLEDILNRYTRFLGMEIVVYHPVDDLHAKEILMSSTICDVWDRKRKYGQRFIEDIDGNRYDIMLELDQSAQHEIYQNKVFITHKYNLLSHDLESAIYLPNLKIRIDGHAFTLPFGRHCLADESCLDPIADHLRENLLPQFFDHLVAELRSRANLRMDIYRTMIHELAIALMQYIPGLDYSWSQIPVFRIYPDGYMSLADLEKQVVKDGKIYVAELNAVGVDYSTFDGPVIMNEQLGQGLNFLQQYFQPQIINLSLKDVVIEAPSSLRLSKSKEEELFQKNLGFHEDLELLEEAKTYGEWEESMGIYSDRTFTDFDDDLFDFPEVEKTKSAFERLTWRANHLVAKDGKSPSTSHKFILIDDEVILNLYHPEVKKLVKISSIAPKLAGHWAVAQCLTENTKIMSYLSADARENLIMIDGMARINTPDEVGNRRHTDKKRKNKFRDLLDDTDYDFGLN